MAGPTTSSIFLPNGDRIDFTLDGLASSDQMDKLIKLTAEMLKTWDIDNKAAKEALGEIEEAASEAAGELDKFKDKTKTAGEKFTDSIDELDKVISPLADGNFRSAFRAIRTEIPGIATSLALGVGAVIGGLVGYADQLKEGLQRGISGNIFDFAIAAKTAGLTIGEFSKALTESGGSFAILGTGATDGAKQFGALIGSVREATKGVGNLGLSNDQMAIFTAQQVKVAAAQGFKGRQAQEVVIRNSRMLGEELDNLANRTGKTTLELAASAAKLAQDPFIASFVKTAAAGSKQVSEAVQLFTASLRGIFGEKGEKVAQDALQSAMSGLPFIITETGKNLQLASMPLYNEVERLAKSAAAGGKIQEADRVRLMEMAKQEVVARGDQLRQFAMLGGALGEGARAILELATEAETYNDAEKVKRRAQDKTAQEFNAAIRDFQANLQALAIPFLKLLNNIDWGAFVSVISAVIGAFNKTFEYIGKFIDSIFSVIPGLESVHGVLGTIAGGLLGFGAVIVGAIGVWKLLTWTSGKLSAMFGLSTKSIAASFAQLQIAVLKLKAAMELAAALHTGGASGTSRRSRTSAIVEILGGELNEKMPKSKLGRVAAGAGAMVVGGAISGAVTGPAESASGTVGNVAGTVAGGLGGMALGRIIGGGIGAFLGGPIGIALFSTLGGVLGQVIGDKVFGQERASEEIAKQGETVADVAEKRHQELRAQNQQLIQQMQAVNENAGYGNQINARGVAYAASTERKIADLRFNTG